MDTVANSSISRDICGVQWMNVRVVMNARGGGPPLGFSLYARTQAVFYY